MRALTFQIMIATGLLLLSACSPASTQPLPRLEHYDFVGQTPEDLVRLRQIAPAEGPEGALARYALARAHAEWLVLGLIADRNEDRLLRLLAVDLGVEDASADDPLSLAQLGRTIELVLLEVELAAAAGGEARHWSGAMESLLEGVAQGWEEFGPPLFRAVAEASEEPGPARTAADLLAVGWSRVVMTAAMDRPAAERLAFFIRMASFHDPEVAEALAGEQGVWDEHVGFGCDEAGRDLDELAPAERLARVRQRCSAEALGLPPEATAVLSPELTVSVAILEDLLERRQRLAGPTEDPLVAAAAEPLARFDQAAAALRLPLPLPMTSPEPPEVAGPGLWRPTAVVVVVGEGQAPTAAFWPVLAVVDRQPRLLDQVAGASWPGRPIDQRSALFEAAGDADLGVRPEAVALVAEAGLDREAFFELVEGCHGQGAEARAVELIARWGEANQLSLPLTVARGAARGRRPADRRALIVLGPTAVQVGIADGTWAEVQDGEAGMSLERVAGTLRTHISGRGNPSSIVAVRSEVELGRLARLLDFLARQSRSAGPMATDGWDVVLDPEPPPTPMPVADTASSAVALHRVRLRECYERYLRGGGEAQGALVLELTVGVGGEVTEARVASSELGPQPALDNCLVAEGRRIRFPPDTDAPVIRVRLRFVPR